MSEDLIFWHNFCMLIFEPRILQKGKKLGFVHVLQQSTAFFYTDLPNALADAPKSEYI